MIWPFKKKPAPQPTIDNREWNEDWRVGDIAECIRGEWPNIEPWLAPRKGEKLKVAAFRDGRQIGKPNVLLYGLVFAEYDGAFVTTGFRKVLPVKEAEETSIGEKILKAKPAPDIKRPKPAKVKS